MTMPDLENLQDEWKVKEVQNKHQIKNVLYYLIKWVTWLLEYNSYEPASHLIGALRAIANYEHALKRKRKEVRAAGQIENPTDDETAPRKRART